MRPMCFGREESEKVDQPAIRQFGKRQFGERLFAKTYSVKDNSGDDS